MTVPPLKVNPLFSAGDTNLTSPEIELNGIERITITVYTTTVDVTLQVKAGTQWVPVREYIDGSWQSVVYTPTGRTGAAIIERGIYRLAKASADSTVEASRYNN